MIPGHFVPDTARTVRLARRRTHPPFKGVSVRLSVRPKDGKTLRSTRTQNREQYEQANQACARIIAADPVKYPPDSLPALWAEMILNLRTARTAPAVRRAA
jgi:hypothetical protein